MNCTMGQTVCEQELFANFLITLQAYNSIFANIFARSL